MHRVGFGYDSHRFAPGRKLLLGGVEIPFDRGLGGHSDADAALHAITDAILGAMAAGDIGEMFPDSDAEWAGADSSRFVEHAVNLARSKGWRIANCDVTIIAEQPKLGAYKEKMRTRIAELLRVGPDFVSVKAKTNDEMGPIGRGEGIAALAVVCLSEVE